MSASDLWSLHAEGERLHPTMELVLRRYDLRSLDDPVDPAEVSDVLRELAADEAMMRRGIELAQYLQQAFSAATSIDSGVGVAQLCGYSDLWAARAREYVRCGAWTVWRAQRVAYRAELAAAAAAKEASAAAREAAAAAEKEEAAARARAERLLVVRAAVQHALAKREEDRRAEEEERAEAARAEKERVEAERSRAERLSKVRAAVERALEQRSEEERAAKQELAISVDFAAAREPAAGATIVALPTEGRRSIGALVGNNVADVAGSEATNWALWQVGPTRSGAPRGGGHEQCGRLPRNAHGDRQATMSGPGPPRRARYCDPAG